MKAVLRVFGRLSLAAFLAVGSVAVVGSTLVATAGAVQAAPSIIVRGNHRIDDSTVRSYFRNGDNGRLDSAAIDQGIKRLYGTGLFSDVRVSRSGGALVVTVNENEVINQIAFEGNSTLKDPVLLGIIESKPRGPFSAAVVQGDTQRILEAYRHAGHYAANVTPETISLANGRVNLVFKIKEAGRTKIDAIRFVGNHAFSDSRLRGVMTTTESNFLSFLKSTDIYDPDRINADLELVRKFYVNHGYADFRVVSSVGNYAPGKNDFVVTITVDEGPLYHFGKIALNSSVPDVKTSSLHHYVETSQGDVYDAGDVQKSIESMSVDLAKSGYAFADVRPRATRDYQNHTISVDYTVEEGARVYIERIAIHGNTRTRDYVIRREFDLAEGDAYNQALIDRAKRRLTNLGFFKTVNITTEPGSAPDRVIVDVAVQDQPTGQFSISGGYSTADGLISEIGVGEKNFMGRGEYIHGAVQLGQYTRGASFSFTEPYFLGRRLSAGIDLNYLDQDETQYSSYKIKTYGATLRLGVPITENFQVGFAYQIYSRDITVPRQFQPVVGSRSCDPNAAPVPPATHPPENCASIALLSAQGQTLTSLIGYSLTYNTLDNVNDPSNGIIATFHQDFAGLGGDSQFVRQTADVHYYHELPYDFVGMLRAQGGNIFSWGGSKLNTLDNFYKGQDLVRGFAPLGIGPRDVSTGRLDPLGGTTYFGGTAELQFPLFGIPRDFGLRGALFADAGSLFGYDSVRSYSEPGYGLINANVRDSHKIRSSVGVSLLWKSPIGPLRFNYAYVLSKDRFDRTQAFSFSGGTSF